MKTYWIIGASSGIGAALAQKLASEGNFIILSARNEEKLAAIAKENIENYAIQTIDIENETSRENAFAIIFAKYNIDSIILCAGSYWPDNPLKFDLEVYEKTFRLNVLANMACLEQIIPYFLTKKSGQIAIISSVAGFIGLPYAAAYGGSKAALHNIAESLAPALLRENIDLKIINPGFVDTPLTQKNEFPMPFLINADESARIISKGLKSKKFAITFPWKMALSMQILKLLPYKWRIGMARQMLKK